MISAGIVAHGPGPALRDPPYGRAVPSAFSTSPAR